MGHRHSLPSRVSAELSGDTTGIATSPGVVLGYVSEGAGGFTLYDNASALSGTVVSRVPTATAAGATPIMFPADARPRFENGLSLEESGTLTGAVIYYSLDSDVDPR